MQHGDHPRFFARVPGPSSFAAVLGEWLGTGHNAICASWAGGSGPATVELVVIEWLRQLMGMPAGTEGVLMSGGSLANLTAFAAARATLGQGVAYLTDQTHSSLARDLLAMGFVPEQVRILPSDADLRMPMAGLAAAIAADRAAGRQPMMVVASAGTTNTATVDPLPEIAELCRAEGMWFHVDGAYGAPGALCERGRADLAGMELANSLVLDPHKWLFQPYDVGCVLVRRPGALDRAFSMNPEYLKDVMGDDRRGRFPQPQPRADPPLPRAQAVADLPHLRRRSAARGRGARHRAGGARRGPAAARPAYLGSRYRGPARHRHLRAAGRRCGPARHTGQGAGR